ncbi:28787_t:CDS:1, partial [Gigaspora margarita]
PIGNIDLDTLLPVGHHICKSGYGTHSWCGKIHTIHSSFFTHGIRYANVIKAHINVLENDIGGTIFYFRITDDNTYIELVGYGICTYYYTDLIDGIVITPLSHIKYFRNTRRLLDDLEFINSNNLGLLP